MMKRVTRIFRIPSVSILCGIGTAIVKRCAPARAGPAAAVTTSARATQPRRIGRLIPPRRGGRPAWRGRGFLAGLVQLLERGVVIADLLVVGVETERFLVLVAGPIELPLALVGDGEIVAQVGVVRGGLQGLLPAE